MQEHALEPTARYRSDITLPFNPFAFGRRASAKLRVNGVDLGGEETVRVIVRQRTFDKIAHKLERMGDFQPEGVL